jgi:hypothetical protein
VSPWRDSGSLRRVRASPTVAPRKTIPADFRRIERTAPIKLGRGVVGATQQSPIGISTSVRTAPNLAVLPVLLSILQDTANTPAERRRVASELAQYFLPKKPPPKKSRSGKFAADQYGFVVDPGSARELRDTKLKLACLPISKGKFTPYAMAQQATKLQTRIKEIQDSLQCPCPSKYRLKQYIRVDGRDTVVDGEIVQDKDRLDILRKRRVDKKIFPSEEDLEEAIRTARYDSFIKGPEMTARHRLAELREKEHAAKKGYGPPFTPAQQAEFRLLALLYPPPPNPQPSEIELAEHPFRDPPVADGYTVPSRRQLQGPASTRPQPKADEEFVEFDDDKLPPYCTIDRELSDKLGKTVFKWTYEKYP